MIDVPRQWCSKHFQKRHETGWERLHCVKFRESNGLHLYRNTVGPWVQSVFMPSATCQNCEHKHLKHDVTFVRGTGAVRMELVKPICVSMNTALSYLGFFPGSPISPGNMLYI